MTEFNDVQDTQKNELLSLITSIKIVSGEEYLLKNVPDLHTKIEEVMQLEHYHPKYFLWRVFLYQYFYSNCDLIASERFSKTFLSNDRAAYIIPTNVTSNTIRSYISSTRTTSRAIFNGITGYDFTNVLQAASHFISNDKILLNIIKDNEVFKKEVQNAININTFHSIYIAYFLMIYRLRSFQYWDTELAQKLLPKWMQWCNAYKQYFYEIQKMIGDRDSIYFFYNNECKTIQFRLLDFSIETLTSAEIKNVSSIYDKEFNQLNSLSKDLLIDFVRSFPLYITLTFDLYDTWNMLYDFYTNENQTILQYYRLFLIGERLYKKNLRAIKDLNYYIRRNDIGLQCINLKKLELFNSNIDINEADVKLNEYFNDLVSRGIIDSNRREEVLYAIRQTY